MIQSIIKQKKQIIIFLSGVFLSAAIILGGGILARHTEYTENVKYIERESLFRQYNSENVCDIVFLGDSITQRCDFNELMNISNSVNRGIEGDTTEGILNRIEEIVELKPKKIFIMIGINDLAQEIEKGKILSNFKEIILFLHKNIPQTEVYIESILPVANKSSIDNQLIYEMNSRIKELSTAESAEYIDIFSKVYDGSELDSKYTIDGIHLLGEGYDVIRQTIKPYIFG